MSLLRKLFYRKPPDGLLEICERVYVFDSCFNPDALEEQNIKRYVGRIVSQLKEHYPDAAILAFNFREGEIQSQMAQALTEYDMTIMEYPRQYEDCPLLPMEVIHHFLRSSESWLSLGLQNLLLMHCERGGWPILAFMLAGLLIYRKHYSGEFKTLDMVYKQAPREHLHLLSPLNPIPSQLRYLQYISRRNVATEWPPSDRALTMDCVIIRTIPNFDGEGGCQPIFRICGQDPLLVSDRAPKVLFSTPKNKRAVRNYKQGECELVKIDINCHIQGDVVLECISIHDDSVVEQTMFRVMFNTSFIRSNILMLNRDEIDMPWHAKDQFPKDFRAEVLFSEMDTATSVIPMNHLFFEEKDRLPAEAFAEVHEIFSGVDWLDPRGDTAVGKVSSSSTETDRKSDEPHHLALDETGAKKTPSPPSSILPLDEPKKQPESITDKARKDDESSQGQPPFSPPSEEKGGAQGEVSVQDDSATTSTTPALPLPPPPPPPPQPQPQPQPQPPPIPENLKLSPSNKENSIVGVGAQHSSLLSPHLKSSSSKKIETPEPEVPNESPSSKGVETSSEPLPQQPPSVPPPPAINAPLPPPPTKLTKESSSREGRSHACYVPVAPPSLPPPPSDPRLKETPAARPAWQGPTPPMLPSLSQPPPPTAPKGDHGSIPSAPPPPPSTKQPGSSAGPPPPPPPSAKQPGSSAGSGGGPPPPPPPSARQPGNSAGPPPPLIPPPGMKGKNPLSRASMLKNEKKLKPLHWLKITRAVSGSLWADSEKAGETSSTPEIDMSELESLFSAAAPNANRPAKKPGPLAGMGNKPEKVQLIDHRRAYNCEIMLSQVKIPLHDMLNSILALEDSAIDADQVDNLLKFCPTKEEMEMLKGYKGEKDKLGKCEQFFMELMQVPRIEPKLGVFSFKIQFQSQVSDLRKSLNVVNSAGDEIKDSAKLKRIMQTILDLGNALNRGTARGSAVGFKLDSLLKLTDTRALNKKMTLMHYLCKVLADKLPELLDFWKDLSSLEPASKVQLKFLAEEMQSINKGLEKIVQELSMSENDGPVSDQFRKALKEFLCFSESEVRSLAALYAGAGRNVDSLILYFGEDPARCPLEQVLSTLLNFVKMFKQAHEENCKQQEAEKRKAEKEASEKGK